MPVTTRDDNRDGTAGIPGDYQYMALTAGNPVQRFWHRGKLMLACELFRDRSPGRLLDLGCGSGNLVYELAQLGNRVVGLDLNRRAVLFSKDRCQGLRAQFVVGDGVKLPFSDHQFDATVIMEVIEHLSEQAGKHVLQELRRVTKRGGWLLVTCPNRKSLWPLIERILDAFHLVPRLRGGQHQQEFSVAELETALTDAGYRILQSGSFHVAAPFAALLSWRFAERLFCWEVARSSRAGSLIYCLAKQPR